MRRTGFIFLTAILVICHWPQPAMCSHESISSVSANIDHHTGSATMTIPVVVPSGRAGIQPNIQLQYSSGLSNDLLGVGWSLELGSIQRSTKRGVPTYDPTDTFVLRQTGSTQELADIGGGAFAAKLEGSFMKIEFVTGTYWRVTDKNGIRYYFGEDQTSQEYDPGDSNRIFKWCLNRVEDIHGNTMTLDYIREGSRLYPQAVYYTGNSRNSLLPFAGIEFTYEPRGDVSSSYIAGFKRTTSKRISNVEVKAEGQLQRKYTLQYDPSNRTNRSLLTSVVQYGADGQTSLPPVTLMYQDNAEPAYTVNAFAGSISGNNRWNIRWAGGYDRGHDNYGPVPPGAFGVAWQGPSTAASGSKGTITWSVNGNGHLSFSANKDSAYWMWTYLYVDGAKTLSVPYTSGGVVGTWLNNNYSNVGKTWNLQNGYNLIEITAYHQHSGFSFNLNSQLANEVDLMDSSQVSFPALFSGDFNGDGLADTANFNVSSGKAEVMLSGGTTFSAAQAWITGFGKNQELIPGDFNGDGKTDISCFNKSNGDWRVALSSGGQFIDAQSWISGFGINEHPHAGDINGDGKTDIISFYKAAGAWRARFALNSGTNFQVQTGTNSTIGNTSDIPFVSDFNADGLMDLGAFNKAGGNWAVKLNKGNSDLDFEPLTTVSGVGNNRNLVVSDANSDGMVDIGYYDYSAGKVNTVLFDGTAFVASKQLPFQSSFRTSSAQAQSADYNGDGIADFIVRAPMGDFEVALSAGTFSDLLSSVNNGVGGVTSIVYEPSTQYDNASLPFAIQMVKSVALSNSRGDTYTTAYDYSGGLWDSSQREFRGFHLVKKIDAEGNYSETEILQDDIFEGRVSRQSSYDLSGNVFSKAVNAWDAQEVHPGVHFVFLKRKDNFVFDGDNTGRRTAEEFFYEETPQLGNLTRAVQMGEVDMGTGTDIGSDQRTVETSYVHNTEGDTWLAGLPGQTVVKDHAGGEVRKTWFYYDGNDNTAAPGKGLLTKKEDWAGDAPGSVNPVTLYTYDDIGNLLTTTDPRGNITAIAYDAQYHIFPLTTTNTLGHQVRNEYYGVDSVPLDSSDGYTGLWGQIKSTTDPNQQVGKRVYNALGDVVATVSPLDSIAYPTRTTEIEFLSDHIRITTRQRINHGKPETIDAVSFKDGLGRVLQTKSRSETAGQYIVSGQTEYNSRGLPDKQYLAYFSQNPADVIDPVDISRPHTMIHYDAMGRVAQTANPDGTFSNVAYDDWTTVTVDENGHKQESDFDAYGRLVEKREYLGADGRSVHYAAAPYALYAATLYTYDSEGNLVQTQDAHGNMTAIVYDNLGRKITMNDPDMGVWQYAYDLNGNLTKQTDAKGRAVDFTYDALNRLVNKTDGGTLDVDYTYDNDLVNYSKGRLTQAQYGGGDTGFHYDSIGREIQSIKKINSKSYGVQRSYDAVNELLNIQYPDQKNIFYQYNPAGQIEAISNDESLFIGPQSFHLNSNESRETSLVKREAGTESRENPQSLRFTEYASRDTNIWTNIRISLVKFYTGWFEPHILGIREVHAQTVGDIIIDNTEAKLRGSWYSSTGMANYYGSDYLWGHTESGEDKVIWRPTIAVEGAYKVYYHLPDGSSSRPTNAKYIVRHTGGTSAHYVNQEVSQGGQWILLGEYDFAAGTAGFVKLHDKNNGQYTIADAVKFVYAGGGNTLPPAVTLTASPDIITEGETAALSWNATDAASCTASGGWTGNRPVSGNEDVTPAATSTYVLNCTGDGGTDSASVTVTVNPLTSPPPAVTLAAAPGAVTEGETSTLSWNATDATGCSASGDWTGSKAVSGNEVVAPATTSTYILDCAGDGGTDSDSVTVTVNPLVTPPPGGEEIIIDNTEAETDGSWESSTSKPNYYGTNYYWNYTWSTGSLYVKWRPVISTAGDYKVYYYLPDGSGNRPTDARYRVYYDGGSQLHYVNQQEPGGTWKLLGTYPFAEGTGGYVKLNNKNNASYTFADAVKFVYAGGGNTVTPEVTLTASPNILVQGETAALDWNATDAANCTASGDWIGSRPVTGTEDVAPAATSTYVLDCTGDGGTDSANVTVMVDQSDVEAPTAPQNLTITNTTTSSLGLGWDASTDNVGVAGYRLDAATDMLFYNTVTGYNDKDLGKVTSTTIAGLTADTLYYVRLRAYDAVQNVSPNSAGASGSTRPPSDVEPPAAPAGLVLSNPTATTLYLTWNAPADNVGVTGYRLDVAADAPFNNTVNGYDNKDLGDVVSTTITGLSPDTIYYARLRAYDAAGNVSLNSMTASLRTAEQAPLQPGALDYTAFTEADEHDTVHVSPACVAFTDLESRASNAYIYKAQTTSGDFIYEFDAMITSADTFAGETAVWGVSNTAGTTYDEWNDGAVVSFYKSGSTFRLELEDFSGSFADNSAALSFNQRYYVRVQRAGSALTAEIYSDAQMTALVDTLSRSSSTDTYMYLYGFSAENGSSTGRKITGDVCNLFEGGRDREAPSVPAGLTAAPVSDVQIDLTWDASTDNRGVDGYRVYRDGVEVTVTAQTDYSDMHLNPETAYSYTVSAFDAAGNESGPSAPAGATTLSAAADPQLFVKNVDYNAHGQITRIEYGNGTVTTRTYNPLNLRLERIYTVNALSEVLQDLNYTYDSVGNVKSIIDNVNTADQTFKYDELNRLVEAAGETYGTKTYQYDEIGNTISKDDLWYTYGEGGAGPHAVTSLSDGTTFTYDANGNTATKQDPDLTLTEYVYDTENRLVEVKKAGATIAKYAYDGDGGRTKKTTAGMTTKFVGSLYEEDVSLRTKYVFLGGARVASVTNGHVMYYHADHLGGANILTDADGAMKELIEYEPFGSYARHDKYGTDEELARFYFTGQRRDEETGLYYYGARYYDPSLGRFLTPDIFVQASGDPQSFNRYSYARNNPVNLVDPSGHFFGFIAAIFSAISSAISAVASAVSAVVAEITVASIAQGAVAGGVLGGISAGIQGTNIGQGIGLGILGGAIGGGIGFGVGTALEGSLGSFAAGVAGAGVGGAFAGAAVNGAIGADVGLGVLAGLAGGVVSFAGGRIWPLGAEAIAGGVSSTIQGGKFGEGAKFGAIGNAMSTMLELAIPMSTIESQDIQGGDLVFMKAQDPVGVLISFLEGGAISHVGTAVDSTQMVSATPGKGVTYQNFKDFKGRQVSVNRRFRGNNKLIRAAIQQTVAKPPLTYNYVVAGKGRVCSTCVGNAISVATGMKWTGIGPNSQYNTLKTFGE